MPKLIPLTQGQFAIVDNEDYRALMKYKWFAHYNSVRNTYTAERGKGVPKTRRTKLILMHRQIINTPDGMETDHINHNTLDNRKSNLRVCTKSQNLMNRKLNSNNKSSCKGVYFDNTDRVWKSQITYNKKQVLLGRFKKLNDAILARKQAEIKYFGEFAYKNTEVSV